MSYSPNTFKNDLNTDKLTAIFDKLATTLTSVSTSPLDTKTLAQNFAEAMKNVNIQTTAVVKTNNSFGESSMNNASRYTS